MATTEKTPIERDWSLQRETAVAWLRLVFAVLAIAVIQLNPSRIARFPLLSEFSLGTFLVYSFVALYCARKNRLGPGCAGIISTALDVVFIATIVYSTGGVRTPFFFYYSFPVVTASLRWGVNGSLLVALVGVTVYTVMRLTEESIGQPITVDTMMVRNVYLIALAVVFGYISEFEQKQNRKLLALLRTAGQVTSLQERRRITNELHDGILNSLAVLILRLETCRTTTPSLDGALERNLREVEDLTRNAMKEIRQFLAGKNTQPLVCGTLAQQIRDELGFLRGGLGIRAILETEPEDLDLPQDLEREVYYVIREALTNVTRHSNASRVEIYLQKRQKDLEGTLVDNGVGMNLSTNSGSGVGLQSMRDRIEKFGGEFKIKSSPGAGTKITFIVPINSLQLQAERANYHAALKWLH